MLGGTTVIINNACDPGSDADNSTSKGINYDSMIRNAVSGVDWFEHNSLEENMSTCSVMYV